MDGYRGIACETMPLRVMVTLIFDIEHSEYMREGSSIPDLMARGLAKALELPAGAKPSDWFTVVGTQPGSTVVDLELKSKGLVSAVDLNKRLTAYTPKALTVVLGMAVLSVKSSEFEGANRTCSPPCAWSGVCNARVGHCSCVAGYTGADCSQQVELVGSADRLAVRGWPLPGSPGSCLRLAPSTGTL